MNKETHNPYAANVPQLPQNIPQKEEMELPKNSPSVENVKEEAPKAEVIIKKPLLSLAAYGSGSDCETEDSTEEEEEEKKEVYKVPSGDTQVIIDKMAMYVSKNGEQFETLVKARGDPRFHFLNDDHEFNKYYKERIRELKGSVKTEEIPEKREVREVKPPKKEKKVIGACFVYLSLSLTDFEFFFSPRQLFNKKSQRGTAERNKECLTSRRKRRRRTGKCYPFYACRPL